MIDSQDSSSSPAKKSGRNSLMLIVSGVLVVALIAVGVLYGLEVGKLNKANSNIADLEANVSSLESQLATEQANVADLQTQLAAEQANVADLQTQLASTQADLSASQDKVTSLTSDLSDANNKVASLTSDLATANAKVTSTQADLDKANADLTTVQGQLADIQTKYPLKDFPDYNTLSAWVSAHVQSYTLTYTAWYSHALKMQSLAAEDGYYISAILAPDSSGYLMVYNSALVGSTLYFFDPEDASTLESVGSWGR